MSRAQVEITLRIGQYGERVETVAVVLGEGLARELTEPAEYSHDPLPSIIHRQDVVRATRKKFQLRRETARELAKAIENALVKVLGTDDEWNGYKIKDMSPAEQQYHRERGRFPA